MDYINWMIETSRGGHTGQRMHEDSPLEAPVGGFNRHTKLMSPATREKVLESRRSEIEAFAEDRGIDSNMVMAIAEAAMRTGRVPMLAQYGFAGDDAKAIKHFVAGEVLNLAIEDVQQEATTGGAGMGATVSPMQIGSAFLQRGVMVNADYYDKRNQDEKALKAAPRVGVDMEDKQAYTMDDLLSMSESQKKPFKIKGSAKRKAKWAHMSPQEKAEYNVKHFEDVEGADVSEGQAGTDAPSKADTKLGKKLKKNSPAYTDDDQFDAASGGSTTPVKRVESMDWREAMRLEREARA